MRSILTFAIAGIIAASAIAPASAATKHKRHAAPPTEENFQGAPVAARSGMPGVVWQQPSACFTDEGYGRFASCDQAGY